MNTTLRTTCKWCGSSDLHLNIHTDDYHAADIKCKSCGKWNMWVAKKAINLLKEASYENDSNSKAI